MAQPETHTLCSVTITVSPTNRAPFLAALRPVWDACVAEPENLFFDVFESPEQKGKFRFMEVWKGDKAWFMEVQVKKPYYGPYLEKTEGMWIVPREIEFAERVPGWVAMKDGYVTGDKIEEGK